MRHSMRQAFSWIITTLLGLRVAGHMTPTYSASGPQDNFSAERSQDSSQDCCGPWDDAPLSTSLDTGAAHAWRETLRRPSAPAWPLLACSAGSRTPTASPCSSAQPLHERYHDRALLQYCSNASRNALSWDSGYDRQRGGVCPQSYGTNALGMSQERHLFEEPCSFWPSVGPSLNCILGKDAPYGESPQPSVQLACDYKKEHSDKKAMKKVAGKKVSKKKPDSGQVDTPKTLVLYGPRKDRLARRVNSTSQGRKCHGERCREKTEKDATVHAHRVCTDVSNLSCSAFSSYDFTRL